MRKRSDVAETLRQRLISARHFGTLAPDGRLPSARTIAAELDVDPRVVVAAYRTLEREGIVEQRPPSRSFFAVGAVEAADQGSGAPSGLARSIARPQPHADDWLAEVLAQAVERDVPLPAFPDLARSAVESRRVRAVCIECNTDQLVWLCRELTEDYGVESAGVEVADIAAWLDECRQAEEQGGAAPRPSATLRQAELFVTTGDHAALGTALGARLDVPCVVVAQRDDLLAEIDRALDRDALYYVITDPRFAEKLRRQHASRPHGGQLVPVILERGDEVAELSAGAPAYVMRTARDRLGGVPAHLRALSTLRSFSADTRRTIVRHVVRANLRVVQADARARQEREGDTPSG